MINLFVQYSMKTLISIILVLFLSGCKEELVPEKPAEKPTMVLPSIQGKDIKLKREVERE